MCEPVSGPDEDHVKMQNQNTTQSPDQTQKTLIPKVRYHPSIQTPTPVAGPSRTRLAARRPPQTGPVQKNQDADDTPRVHPGPAVRPQHGTQKPLQRDLDPDRVPPRPDRVPPGLGVQVDRRVVDEVEVLTRGQSLNQDWFSWRKNRITASMAHCIAHCNFVKGKTRTPPRSYLTAITGQSQRVQTRAMTWGIQMEPKAVLSYQKMKSEVLGRPVVVWPCGLFLDARRSWLAASPDGIVTDSWTGERLLCLEVKCPYKHRDRRVEDACRDDPAFCLQLQDPDTQPPSYRLKTSHPYYTQVQVQLAVLGLQQADFMVFTLKETAIVPVTFDPELWAETLSRLEMFYKDAVLPHMRGTRGLDTPEL